MFSSLLFLSYSCGDSPRTLFCLHWLTRVDYGYLDCIGRLALLDLLFTNLVFLSYFFFAYSFLILCAS